MAIWARALFHLLLEPTTVTPSGAAHLCGGVVRWSCDTPPALRVSGGNLRSIRIRRWWRFMRRSPPWRHRWGAPLLAGLLTSSRVKWIVCGGVIALLLWWCILQVWFGVAGVFLLRLRWSVSTVKRSGCRLGSLMPFGFAGGAAVVMQTRLCVTLRPGVDSVAHCPSAAPIALRHHGWSRLIGALRLRWWCSRAAFRS